MAGTEVIGVFEEMVLLAVMRGGEEAQGMTVRDEIRRIVDRKISLGAVYATLDRLYAKGFLSARTGDPDPIRGGRPRRYFRVQPLGVEALRRSSGVRQAMWAGVSLPREPKGT